MDALRDRSRVVSTDISGSVPRGLKVATAYSWRFLVVAAAIGVAIWVVIQLKLLVIPLMVAIGMSLVDSYRRRGKKPKPFPTRTAQETKVGDGAVTTYTFGQDLYDDMLAAIEGAKKQVLLETYIWKGDAVGQRFKKAVIDAADRLVAHATSSCMIFPPPD